MAGLDIEDRMTDDRSSLADLGQALRTLQDCATATTAPLALAADVAAALVGINEVLAPFNANRESVGSDLDAYMRARSAHTLMPPMEVRHRAADSVEFSVRFGIFYRNPFGQVHGGAIAMVFDTAIARLGLDGERRFLTANLSVDYRRAAPIDVELIVRIRVDRAEGRKRFIEGQMVEGEAVIAEVHALFIESRI